MRRSPTPAAVAGALVVAALAVLCTSALAWRLTGGRWYAVATPSMGQAAPVGTLLLTRPTRVSAVRVGDIITFHPPGTSEVYSHRVIATTAAGLRTRGDINGSPDPWIVTGNDLIGTVDARWWGMGWVLRGLPLLLICLLLTHLIAAAMTQRWRSPARVLGTAASVSFVAWRLHPWIGLTKLYTSAATHGVAIKTVSTGILPTRAQALHGGSQVQLLNGQVGTVTVTGTDRRGVYLVSGAPGLDFWWWVIVVLICLAPLLWCLSVGLAPVPAQARAEPGGSSA